MGYPAILGGDKAVNLTAIEFDSAVRWPQIGNDEIKSIAHIFDDSNISTHPIIREIEQAYASRMNRTYALAHNNGTTALMAAFWSLNLKDGNQFLFPLQLFGLVFYR